MSEHIRLDPVPAAIAAIAAGRPVVVVDDADRENEGDLIYAAALATDEVTAFTVRHTSGVICAPLPAGLADRLALPPMTTVNEDPKGTAYTVSVDAAAGVTTGISAADRTRTLRVLADPGAAPGDLTRPGHVFPLRAVPGGVRARRGHTEAGVELCRLAGVAPVAAIAELVHDDGTMMRLPALREFSDEHGLVLISIEDLVAHLEETTPALTAVPAEATLPTRHGLFRVSVHVDAETGAEHLLLVAGETDPERPLTVRVHSECLTGDVLGSLRCDCGPQLEDALARAATEGGVGCDVAIECVGNEHALKACLDAVRKQGVVVQTGLHPHDNPLDWFAVTFKDVDLRGSWAYPTHYWPRVAGMIASGALPAAKVVTRRIGLDEAITEGFDRLLDPAGTQLKILIDLSR